MCLCTLTDHCPEHASHRAFFCDKLMVGGSASPIVIAFCSLQLRDECKFAHLASFSDKSMVASPIVIPFCNLQLRDAVRAYGRTLKSI